MLGLNILYVTDEGLEVIGVGRVQLVDCRVEIGQSVEADGRSVAISNILRRVSSAL
jgi:hypothetical protein